eukprot:10194068-Lingulodinium_polyedra.AAC.1
MVCFLATGLPVWGPAASALSTTPLFAIGSAASHERSAKLFHRGPMEEPFPGGADSEGRVAP